MKIFGAILIVVGCGGVGFSMCATHRRAENALESMMKILEWMVWELNCRMPPLSTLCREASALGTDSVGTVFARLAQELERQVLPDACACMDAALAGVPRLLPQTQKHFRSLGMGLGKFDLQGQLAALEAEIASCRRDLEQLQCNRRLRLRNYRSLGICAGIALAILLL